MDWAGILSASLALSKVLSTQYFIFLLGALIPDNIRRPVLLTTICCLTGLIFPWFYADLRILNLGAELLLMARNLLLVALSISLLREAWRRSVQRCEK